MEDTGIDESMLLKWIIKICYESVDWINLAQYRFSRGTHIHLDSSYRLQQDTSVFLNHLYVAVHEMYAYFSIFQNWIMLLP
jgi:hypothetical protein